MPQFHTLPFDDPHERGQRRSLALHEAALEVLERHPEHQTKVRKAIERLLRQRPEARPCLLRWRRLLDQGHGALKAAALDPGPDGRVLRSSPPLAGPLTPEERADILRQTKLTMSIGGPAKGASIRHRPCPSLQELVFG